MASRDKQAYESPYLDPSIEEEFRVICDRIEAHGVEDFKKLHPETYTIYQAIRYVTDNRIPGHVIECGVAFGSKIMIACHTLVNRAQTDREIYLYDTFAGMAQPSERDSKFVPGKKATAQDTIAFWEDKRREGHNEWRFASLEVVRENLASTGYPEERLHFLKGDVRETLPNPDHREIALLRLDTDFYESTRHELAHLYDLVVDRGVVIIDDYGAWKGQHQAVNEFFDKRGLRPFLHRSSRKERVIVK